MRKFSYHDTHRVHLVSGIEVSKFRSKAFRVILTFSPSTVSFTCVTDKGVLQVVLRNLGGSRQAAGGYLRPHVLMRAISSR